MVRHTQNTSPSLSRRSWIGLNAVNFLLAEMVGVILPFLSAYLKQKGWDYDQIGITIALAGLGTLLFQIPAGVLCDEIRSRRLLLAACSLILGLCYGIIPLIAEHTFLVDASLFLSGIAGAFFVPLLAALALSLVGRRFFDHTMGVNQGWNHAGNIAAGLGALLLVRTLGITSIFYIVALISFLAAASLLPIDSDEINPDLTQAKSGKTRRHSWQETAKHIRSLFRDNRIIVLVVSVALFHLANAPTMPLVALYLKHLGGGDDKIAWVVIIAQAVMIPVALLAARYCTRLGRKPVFAVAFIALPLRIFLYSLTADPTVLLAIQALDGIGAGIYGVVICLVCSDLTRGKEGFNTLLGITQTAIALGGVLGPFLQGYITQYLGFPMTFIIFSGVAACGTALFLLKMPETRNTDEIAAGHARLKCK